MTKAKSVGQKRRGPKKREGVSREANGRASRQGTQYAIPQEKRDAARRVVLERRCRLMGWPINRDMLVEAAAPHLGCNVGRALHGHPGLAGLWGAAQHIRAVYARYWAVHGLPNPFPQSASLTAMPEPIGSDGVEVDSGWDDRPIEEKSRASTAAMMRIEGFLLAVGCAPEVKASVLRDEPVRDRARLVASLLAVEAYLSGGA